YAAFEAPIVHIKGAGYNILGDHFHPILVLLAPVYALFPTALTLMICQAVLLGISAFFVAAAADHLAGRASGWLIGGSYAFGWGVQEAARVQFHEVAMGAPILAIGLWCLVRERWVAATVWFGLLVFVKEDLGMTVFVLGLLVAWRSRRWLLGVGLAVWGVAWFFLALRVILPAFNLHNRYDYGHHVDLGAVLANPVGTVLEIATNEQKMLTLFMVLACTVLLAFRSNIVLAALPTLAWRFLSDLHGHWGPTWHYSLMLMPVLYVAAAEGVRLLSASARPALRAWGRAGPAMIAVFAIAVLPHMPLWQLTHHATWQIGTPRHQAAANLIARVPEGTVVASDVSLMNQLVDRADVYFIANEGNPVPDLIVIDNRAGGWGSRVDAVSYGASLHPGTSWREVYAAQDYQLVERID
ncbi:MAG: DUF2079 domain-containing protein, partial [Micrococcus sp.]|nr:DUF2079 domain-containing protein [Micrococcus sp.]